jgi:CRISPR/Cas system-associated protein endoribonuclease Cas2
MSASNERANGSPPVPASAIRLILMLDVPEHMDDPIEALRHALDLLVPEGIVIVTVPAFMALWTNHDVLNHHLVRYTKQSFRKIALQSGLLIQEERCLYHWICPVKLGLRFVETVFQTKARAPQVPAGWANEVFFQGVPLRTKTPEYFPHPVR